ncbi:MAG: SpoIIE family protein phosphatase [Leptospirales bacterium]|nr:SpoIIE family protein phosphatase [Leptospirales bacterium]
MRRGPIFFSRYNRWTAVSLLAIVSLSLALLWMQWDMGQDQQESRIASALKVQALSLDATLRDSVNHVNMLGTHSESYFLDPSGPHTAEQTLFGALRPVTGTNYFSMDAIPAPYQERDTGNLTGYQTLLYDPSAHEEIRMSLALGPLFRGTKENIPNAAWVYYTSRRRFINIYPFVPSKDFAIKEELFTHEFYTMGLPSANPDRKTFWTSAYLDEGGKGMMVTCARPVYRNNEFLGTVAVDITLDILTQFVRNFEANRGTAFIINEQGQLLGHPELVSSSKSIKVFQDALPVEIKDEKTLFDSKPLTHIEKNGIGYYYQNLKYAPWKMVFVLKPRSVFIRVFEGIGLVFLIVMFGFFLQLLVTSQLVYRDFIRPARRLVQHIEAENTNSPAPDTVDPPRDWAPWFQTVSSIFQKHRDLLANLEEKVRDRTREILIAKETSDSLLRAMRDDLNLARKIQENMMPFEGEPELLNIVIQYSPRSEVGGDLFDIHHLSEKRVRILIADATGHGVQAALITMAIKSEYENLKQLSLSPGEILLLLNTHFTQKYSALNTYFTCALVDLDLNAGQVQYASAGHPSQVLVSDDRVVLLPRTGRLIGISEEGEYSTATHSFGPADRLYLFTDGAYEQFNKEKQEFGEARLLQVLGSQGRHSVENGIRHLLGDLSRFTDSESWQDDLTLIGIEQRADVIAS